MGIMIDDYLYDYDNPYRILAHYIVGYYRPADVLRVLTENAYIRTLIQKEVREMDLRGSYIDCVIEDLLSNKKRMDYMRTLDVLARYYYESLDKERLRNEIRLALQEAGIELPNHSTGGNDSSANT